MSNIPAKPLALIISAIKNIRNRNGPNPREILNYVTSVCDIPETVARRQVLAALKRGTLLGILQETDGHYTLPNEDSSNYNSIGTQKLGLLNLACRKRKQIQRKKKSMGHCGSMKKKSVRKGRSKSRKTKKMKGCGSSSKRKSRSRKRKSKSRKRSERKSRSKYDCGSKKSRKTKKIKRKKSKRSFNCVCPEKAQRPESKSDGCSVKNDKESNKCKLDFDNITTNPHRKLSNSRSDCQSRTRSRGSRSRSRSRSSMYS